MENKGRQYFVKKNLLYGIGSQILLTLFPFLSRTVFINVLGASYLGVNGLFTSILTVLSLAELGLGNIVIYSLYSPVANNDKDKIAGYLRFYRIIYLGIACVVMLGGLAVAPFLPILVNLPSKMDHLVFYYLLYVVNSAVSYLFVYKTSIIRAAQLQYVVSLYTTLLTGLMNVVQIIALLIFKNFTAYLLIQILFTFLQNYLLSREADRRFPFIKRNSASISRSEIRKIIADIKAMFAYKIGGVLLNSTDSIFISILISTIAVGIYNNYVMILAAINKAINIIYDSVYTSIGNLNATSDYKSKLKVFKVMVLVFCWIATFTSVGVLTCIDDVIRLWVGSKYVSDYVTVIAIALNFFLPIVLYPIWMYRNTTGLFKQTQNILFYTSVVNLFLSYLMGKFWGIAGILFATSVARGLTSFWYEPYVLCKKLFKNRDLKEYFFYVGFSILVTTGSVWVILLSTSGTSSTLGRLILRVLLSLIIPNFVFILYARRRAEWKYVLAFLRRKL